MNQRSMLRQLTARPLDRPCDEPWERMVGDDRVRRCDSCAREVFFLSAMSPREAELRLLNAGDRTPCIRYARRADGCVVHVAEPRALSIPSRSLAAAAALGATLSAAAAQAAEPKAPAQCVAYPQPAAQRSAAPPPPAAQPNAGASAAAPPTPSPAPSEPPPIPLGGAPPPIQRQPDYGTLVLKSKISRQVTIIGIQLSAPLLSYLLTPGAFTMDVREPNGRTRAVRFKIRKDKQTVVDLDRR
jgi:hypothetical protein